jgi:hypothetical protein
VLLWQRDGLGYQLSIFEECAYFVDLLIIFSLKDLTLFLLGNEFFYLFRHYHYLLQYSCNYLYHLNMQNECPDEKVNFFCLKIKNRMRNFLHEKIQNENK